MERILQEVEEYCKHNRGIIAIHWGQYDVHEVFITNECFLEFIADWRTVTTVKNERHDSFYWYEASIPDTSFTIATTVEDVWRFSRALGRILDGGEYRERDE